MTLGGNFSQIRVTSAWKSHCICEILKKALGDVLNHRSPRYNPCGTLYIRMQRNKDAEWKSWVNNSQVCKMQQKNNTTQKVKFMGLSLITNEQEVKQDITGRRLKKIYTWTKGKTKRKQWHSAVNFIKRFRFWMRSPQGFIPILPDLSRRILPLSLALADKLIYNLFDILANITVLCVGSHVRKSTQSRWKEGSPPALPHKQKWLETFCLF